MTEHAWVWPNGTTKQPKLTGQGAFGPRTAVKLPNGQWSSSYHRGVDFMGFTFNCAVTDGVVVFVGEKPTWEGGGRAQVWIQNWDGSLIKYFHGKPGTLLVTKGDHVTPGQRLVRMGQDGNADMVHLHFELSPDGGFWGQVNPIPYLRSRIAETAGLDVKPLPTVKETEVKTYHFEDGTAKTPAGRTVKPGEQCYLHTTAGVPTSQASNIVGGVGAYSITPHVYAEGKPGDAVEITLLWDDTKTTGPHSAHYVERLTLDDDGLLRASREFKRAVAARYAVYLQVVAPVSNKGPVKITRLDADAYLFLT